jgi:hypothetical protein
MHFLERSPRSRRARSARRSNGENRRCVLPEAQWRPGTFGLVRPAMSERVNAGNACVRSRSDIREPARPTRRSSRTCKSVRRSAVDLRPARSYVPTPVEPLGLAGVGMGSAPERCPDSCSAAGSGHRGARPGQAYRSTFHKLAATFRDRPARLLAVSLGSAPTARDDAPIMQRVRGEHAKRNRGIVADIVLAQLPRSQRFPFGQRSSAEGNLRAKVLGWCSA